MKDKEKQIEEMAKLLEKVAYEYQGYCINGKKSCVFNNKRKCCECSMAHKLYEQGYRKLPKDARVFIPTDEQYIMLSREEICELKCQAEEDFNKAYDLGSKETAEKFYQSIIDELMRGCGDDKEFWVVKLINKRAKQFGVEIEE